LEGRQSGGGEGRKGRKRFLVRGRAELTGWTFRSSTFTNRENASQSSDVESYRSSSAQLVSRGDNDGIIKDFGPTTRAHLTPLPCLRDVRFTGYWIGVGSRLSSVIGRGASENDQVEHEPLPVTERASEQVKDTETVNAAVVKHDEDESEGDDDEEEEEDSSDDDGPVEGLDKIQAGFMEECKLVSRTDPSFDGDPSQSSLMRHLLGRSQVLIVRTDLKMTKGKIAAQCG
jgi:hypothetical protein